MTKRYMDTEQEAYEFSAYIQRSGGQVTKIKALRQGFEFDIIAPRGAAIGWGDRALNAFLTKQEVYYVENAGSS